MNNAALAGRDDSAHRARLPGARPLATIRTKNAGPEIRLPRRNAWTDAVSSPAPPAAAALTASFAQDAYPTRAITLINPFPPGGAADVVGRPFAAVLEPLVKQPVVIETKAGAAGQVGAQFAANAKPDGYTLLSTSTSISGFAEVDKLFGRPPKFTRATSSRSRASPTRWRSS